MPFTSSVLAAISPDVLVVVLVAAGLAVMAALGARQVGERSVESP